MTIKYACIRADEHGVSLADRFRRLATYPDKILKGARPDDLPVEQPTKLELVAKQKKPPKRSTSSSRNRTL